MKYVIWFTSLTTDNNSGFFCRNRKVGFTSVYNADSAKKFKTKEEAIGVLTNLEAKEGEYYKFEIREV